MLRDGERGDGKGGEKPHGQTILGPSRSNQGLEDTVFLP